MPTPFLQAEWRKLLMVNYAVPPNLLLPYIPHGTELDLWKNTCFVSLVGFRFIDTRVLGIRVPFHIEFEEVNLRFYVRRKVNNEWHRGVVFIKEIVPRQALSLVANTLYGEHYETLKMYHVWQETEADRYVEYGWKRDFWNAFSAKAKKNPIPIQPNSEEEFIAEHYWGFTRLSPQQTSAYEVTHPTWDVYPVLSHSIDVDFKETYGPSFEFLERERPTSVLLAEGSPIQVLKGTKI